MKTFLLVNLSLLPAILFWTLSGFGHSEWGIGLGALTGVLAFLWNRHRRQSRPMEAAMMLYLLGFGVLALFKFPYTAWAVAGSFAVLGVVGLATCLLSQPWTSAYSAAEHKAHQDSPIFHRVNLVISLTWSLIFMAMALLMLMGLAHRIWPLTIIGVAVSLIAPPLIIRTGLKQQIRDAETYHWQQQPLTHGDGPDDVDIAIIGAGIGGLTAAALLAQAGRKVFVAEQHVVPGGYCHCWLRKTRHNGKPLVFRFDSGVHDISGVHERGVVSSLLTKLGIGITWLRFQQHFAGTMTPYPADWRHYALRLGERHPQSGNEIMRFFEAAKRMFDGLYAVGDASAHVPIPPKTPLAMMAFAKAHPEVVAWMHKPFSLFVAQYVTDPVAQKALAALSGYLTDDADSLSVLDMIPLYGYYFFGGHYPEGGSGILAQELMQSVRRFGGEVSLKAPVAEILVEGDRAAGLRLASGRAIRAGAVISNADLKHTLLALLPPGTMSASLCDHYNKVEPATSAFMVHLGLTGDMPLPGSTSVTAKDGLRIGLVSPSAMDASAAPEGYCTLEMIALVPHQEASGWFGDAGLHDDKEKRLGQAYRARKTAFGDKMIAAAETLIPDLSSRIVLRMDASPLTFSRYDWTSSGAIYGVSKRDRFNGCKSPVKGLWLCGSATHGAGIEAVMIAGATLADALVPDILATKPA